MFQIQKMYAQMNVNGPNEMIMQVDPIQIGDIQYFGCKRVPLKTVKDDNTEKETQVVDESKQVEYDNLTQQFMDAKNNNRLNSQSMLNDINQQRFNSQLMLDNMNLQKMASQLMLEINQLKTGGNK